MQTVHGAKASTPGQPLGIDKGAKKIRPDYGRKKTTMAGRVPRGVHKPIRWGRSPCIRGGFSSTAGQ
ncbi:MAG: hypothetical protein Fur007_08730 [Rhodoferax sp.]